MMAILCIKHHNYCVSKKILLICTGSDAVVNFRSELISYLMNKGFDVDVLASDNKREKDIKKLGVNFFFVPFSNRDKNPFQFRKIEKGFRKAIRESKPDIVFTFQLKPNLFGTRAAKKEKVKHIYSMIEGLGDPFQPSNFKGKVIRYLITKMYKSSLKSAEKVFLLNEEDKQECLVRKIINEKQGVIIHSIGIDMNKYEPLEDLPSEKKVLYLSRLIKNKGIYDYCEIARKVHKVRPDIIFELCGDESSEIQRKDLLPYINEGSLVYNGFLKNVNETIKSARIYLSTSFREGFPRTLLESMALKKVIIASNVIGNKDGVINNKTGYLLPVHDINAFTEKIIQIIDNDELLKQLGNNAYSFCKEHFQSDIINEQICNVLADGLKK